MRMQPSKLPRWNIGCWAAAAALIGLAIFLPSKALVDLLSGHFSTVRGFSSDFIRGLQVLRVACAANGLLLVVLPRLAAGIEFAPSVPRRWLLEDRLPAAALYLLTLSLSAPGLRESFQNDEWRCLEQYVQHGPLVIMTRTAGDNHVLYSLLSWPFVLILGLTEAAVRIPSFLLSPLGPALLYQLLRRDHSRLGSFAAALPLAASPFLISYAHDGRAYGALFPALFGLCLLQPLSLEGSRRAWLSYVGLGVATVYLHIYASVAVVGLAGAALLLPAGRTPNGRARNLVSLLLIAGISFLLYAPLLPKYFDYSTAARGFEGRHAGIGEVLRGAFTLSLPAVWAVPFGVVMGVGLISHRRLTSMGLSLLITAALQFAITGIAASEQTARLYAPTLVLGWVSLSRALAKASAFRPWGMGLALGLLAVTGMADAGYFRLGRRDFRGAVREMAARKRPGETHAAIFDCRPMIPYLREPLAILTEDELMARSPDWITIVDVNLQARPALRAFTDREYLEDFRLPSVGETLLGLRRRKP